MYFQNQLRPIIQWYKFCKVNRFTVLNERMMSMSDYTTVYFTWIKRGFNIPSTLVEFSLFGNEISIKFYGIIIAFGFILAALFGGRMAYKWKNSNKKSE